mmetsp:Transcript_2544/g.8118  ORF Transcript_2544/g.8118 Transcript_2544/m.8118 type:complete len:216 (+) Transcript_2544:801-1448(+)
MRGGGRRRGRGGGEEESTLHCTSTWKRSRFFFFLLCVGERGREGGTGERGEGRVAHKVTRSPPTPPKLPTHRLSLAHTKKKMPNHSFFAESHIQSHPPPHHPHLFLVTWLILPEMICLVERLSHAHVRVSLRGRSVNGSLYRGLAKGGMDAERCLKKDNHSKWMDNTWRAGCWVTGSLGKSVVDESWLVNQVFWRKPAERCGQSLVQPLSISFRR